MLNVSPKPKQLTVINRKTFDKMLADALYFGTSLDLSNATFDISADTEMPIVKNVKEAQKYAEQAKLKGAEYFYKEISRVNKELRKIGAGINLRNSDLPQLDNGFPLSAGTNQSKPERTFSKSMYDEHGIIDFDGIDMRGATIYRTDFSNWPISMENANLENASIVDSQLGDGSSVKNANLSKANLENSVFQDIDFAETNLKNTDLSQAAGFVDCDLTTANFNKSTKLQGGYFAGSDFEGREDLRGRNLSDCNFTNCNFDSTNLSSANLQNSSFDDAVLDDANLSGANANGATFKRADMQNANLKSIKAQNAKFTDADMRFTQVQGADLSKADMRFANIDGMVGSFGTKMTDADVSYAQMTLDQQRVAGDKNANGISAAQDLDAIQTNPRKTFRNMQEFDAYFIDQVDNHGGHVDLSGFDLSNLDGQHIYPLLSNINYHFKDLGYAGSLTLAKTVLPPINDRFVEIDLRNCDLRQADLTNIKGAGDLKLGGADATGANLSGVKVNRLLLGRPISHYEADGGKHNFPKSHYGATKLAYANLRNMKFSQGYEIKENLAENQFYGAQIKDSGFTDYVEHDVELDMLTGFDKSHVLKQDFRGKQKFAPNVQVNWKQPPAQQPQQAIVGQNDLSETKSKYDAMEILPEDSQDNNNVDLTAEMNQWVDANKDNTHQTINDQTGTSKYGSSDYRFDPNDAPPNDNIDTSLLANDDQMLKDFDDFVNKQKQSQPVVMQSDQDTLTEQQRQEELAKKREAQLKIYKNKQLEQLKANETWDNGQPKYDQLGLHEDERNDKSLFPTDSERELLESGKQRQAQNTVVSGQPQHIADNQDEVSFSGSADSFTITREEVKKNMMKAMDAQNDKLDVKQKQPVLSNQDMEANVAKSKVLAGNEGQNFDAVENDQATYIQDNNIDNPENIDFNDWNPQENNDNKPARIENNQDNKPAQTKTNKKQKDQPKEHKWKYRGKGATDVIDVLNEQNTSNQMGGAANDLFNR